MFELLVLLVFVLPWFYRTAKKRGKNPFGWVFIGALSYYVPLLIVGRLIVPIFVRGTVYDIPLAQWENPGWMLPGMLLSIVVGIGGCFIAGRILVSSH